MTLNTNARKNTTVLVADNIDFDRGALTYYASKHEGWKVVGDNCSCDMTDWYSVYNAICDKMPDVALVAHNPLGLDGIAVANEVSKMGLHTCVVLLARNLSRDDMAKAKKARVRAILYKGRSLKEFSQAVDFVLSSSWAFFIDRKFEGENELAGWEMAEKLTPELRAVLILAANHNGLKQTADLLHISQSTVSYRRRRLHEIFGIPTEAKFGVVIEFAYDNGIITPEEVSAVGASTLEHEAA